MKERDLGWGNWSLLGFQGEMTDSVKWCLDGKSKGWAVVVKVG